MALDFLQSIKIDDPGTEKKSGGGSRKQWNPAGLTLRVWKNGAIFPSQEVTDRFSLEFGNKAADDAADASTGNGFDIFRSSDFPIFQTPQEVILLNVAKKSDGKLDAFGSVTYDEGGKPKVSVMDQGAATFGKTLLLPALKEVYGVEPNEEGFIDLAFVGQDEETAKVPFAIPNGKKFCFVPKSVARGDNKGKPTITRREYPELYILYPATLLHPDDAAGAKAIDDMAKRHPDAVEMVK